MKIKREMKIKAKKKKQEVVKKVTKKCSFCGRKLTNYRLIRFKAYSLLHVCNNCYDIWKFMLEEFKAGKQMAVRKIYSKIGDNIEFIQKNGITITKVIAKK